MPDQTPVTDDDRKAHQFADNVLANPGDFGPDSVATARAVKAHVPAPPATLADELRTASWGDIPALADRAEAVEKELAGRKQDYIECQEELIASDLALTEARRERDAARNSEAEMQEQFNQMYEKSQKITNQRDDAWAERDAAREEVERLKEEHSDTLHDRNVLYDRWKMAGEKVDRLEATVASRGNAAPGLPDPADTTQTWCLVRIHNGGTRWRTDADVTLVRPIDLDGLDINEVA